MTLQPISEVGVQAALTLLLNRSPLVRQRVLESLSARFWTDTEGGQLVQARQSHFSENGETDILLEMTHSSGELLQVFIEVKLDAHFMPRQGSRYRERAEQAMSSVHIAATRVALLAPSEYLRTANPEARHFPYHVQLENVVGWATSCTAREEPEVASAGRVISAALERLASGAPLGAKGLHVELYDQLARALEDRDTGIRITNRPTDWVSMWHQALPSGVRLNYRVGQAISEVRIAATFRGDRERLGQLAKFPLVAIRSRGEVFLRLPPLVVSANALKGRASASDIEMIVKSVVSLVDWWRGANPLSPNAGDAGKWLLS